MFCIMWKAGKVKIKTFGTFLAKKLTFQAKRGPIYDHFLEKVRYQTKV